MLLTLDVGNSQIFGGVYDKDELKTTFRIVQREMSLKVEFVSNAE